MSATETEERIYSKVGGWLCLDFTNTIQSYSLDKPNYDYIVRYEDLTTWAQQAELITRQEEEVLNRQATETPARADELLERARALRSTINRVFSAIANERQPGDDDLEALNRELAEA